MTSPDTSLPRFLRLREIIAPHGPLPISKSSWWSGCATGRYPKSLKLGPRITVWRAEDIQALIESINRGEV